MKYTYSQYHTSNLIRLSISLITASVIVSAPQSSSYITCLKAGVVLIPHHCLGHVRNIRCLCKRMPNEMPDADPQTRTPGMGPKTVVDEETSTTRQAMNRRDGTVLLCRIELSNTRLLQVGSVSSRTSAPFDPEENKN